MRSLLEIVTFFTSLDNRASYEEKEKQIIDMISDAMTNSGEPFQKDEKRDKQYTVISYQIDYLRVEFSIKEDFLMENPYFPHLILEVFIEEAHFEKENIESFLNTITRFFSGAFQNDYFISYDTRYSISSMNSGKKYSIEDIERLNINQKDTEENKKLLDSLLYLHYTLERNIQDIFLLEREIGSVISSDGVISAQLEASTLRRDETKNSLITSLKTLHKQIEIVLHYFY
ncbi:hypothetical protein KBC86_04280 [Candidatus Gracilibacteria bacterium]|nr:hypothetical protein [Candidatus Gracilibacteria bacterium]